MKDLTGKDSMKIPSWQLPQETTPSAAVDSKVDSRAVLLENASKFLQDDGVKEASRERKSDFLRAKGLTEEEINELLKEENQLTEDEGRVHESMNDEKIEEVETGIADENARKTTDIDIMDDYIDSESGPSAKEEKPPIITYPEFLLRSQKPAPLITTDRLTSALYLASGTAATMYGLSKYVLEPMVESLTSARHTFFEGASSNIDTLNDKLQSVVSKIPDGTDNIEDKEISDGDSESSDPARFFSRTIATQTSPHLSRSTSSVSVNEKSPGSTAVNHADQISKLRGVLSEIDHENRDVSDQAKEDFRMLTEYLNDLPRLGRIGEVKGSVRGEQTSETRVDGVAKVKAEIKGVKGALLSARNFPAGIASR